MLFNIASSACLVVALLSQPVLASPTAIMPSSVVSTEQAHELVKRAKAWYPTSNRVHVFRGLPTSMNCDVPNVSGSPGTSTMYVDLDIDLMRRSMDGAEPTDDRKPLQHYRMHFLTPKTSWWVGVTFQVEDDGKQNRFKDIQIIAVTKLQLLNSHKGWDVWAECTKNGFGDDIYTRADNTVFDP